MEIISLLFGAFIGFFLTLLTGGAVYAFIALAKAKFKYVVNIRNLTQGKPVKEQYLAYRTMHKSLGEVLVIPKLKSQGREYIPYQGNQYEYSLIGHGNQKYEVAYTYSNGTYAPEVFSEYITQKIKKLQETKNEKGELVFETVEIEERIPLIQPTKSSMRQFNLNQDTAIKDEFAEKKDFFDKWGAAIIAFIIILAAVSIFVFTMVYTGELQKNLPSVQGFAEATAIKIDLIQNARSNATNDGKAFIPPNLGINTG